MARQVSVELVDDLDGGPARSTVRFAVDGHWYDIDLGAANEQALRAALAPYLSAARPATARPRSTTPQATTPQPTAPAPAAVAVPEPATAGRPQQPIAAPAPAPATIPAAAFSNPTALEATTAAGRPSPNSTGIFTHANRRP